MVNVSYCKRFQEANSVVHALFVNSCFKIGIDLDNVYVDIISCSIKFEIVADSESHIGSEVAFHNHGIYCLVERVHNMNLHLEPISRSRLININLWLRFSTRSRLEDNQNILLVSEWLLEI